MRRAQADSRGDALIDHAFHRLRAHIGAHGKHAFERQRHRLFLARRQQIGEVFQRDAQRPHVRHGAIAVDHARLRRRLDRREWRHVPDHRQSPVFGMERKGDLPVHRHFPDRRALCCFEPIFLHAVGASLLDHALVVRVEEDRELGLIEILLVGDARGFLDAVGVVEHHPEIADAADASFRAHGRLSGFDAGEAEDAFLGFAARPVVIDLLVGAARDAHAPAAALVLVDEDDAVLLALVDRP